MAPPLKEICPLLGRSEPGRSPPPHPPPPTPLLFLDSGDMVAFSTRVSTCLAGWHPSGAWKVSVGDRLCGVSIGWVTVPTWASLVTWGGGNQTRGAVMHRL